MRNLQHVASRNKANKYYKSIGTIYCPYFKEYISFTSRGFHHLEFTAGRERKKTEQCIRFHLLQQYVEYILKNSGTVQEYRSSQDAASFWGFLAVVEEDNYMRVKVVIRKIGNGNIHFWSIMKVL